MKVIDLLNKIANGEEIEPIDYKGQETLTYYLFDKCGNECDDTNLVNILNDEVEIVEEDKKIEKLEIVHNGSANAYALLNEYGTKCALTKHSKVMCDKINEIIDKLNEMEKE